VVNGFVGYYIAPSGDMGTDGQIVDQTDPVSAAPNSHIAKTWTATIPAGTAAGTYWLTVACWDSNWNNLWYAVALTEPVIVL
jgi:hypothetical protein